MPFLATVFVCVLFPAHKFLEVAAFGLETTLERAALWHSGSMQIKSEERIETLRNNLMSLDVVTIRD